MKVIFLFLAIWLVFSVCGYLVGSVLLGGESASKYATWRPVSAEITAKEPRNHEIILYKFTVDGVDFQGAGGAGRGNPPFQQISMGQKIVVHYDPASPANSIPGYPRFYDPSNRKMVWFATLATPIFPLLTTLLGYLLWRSQKSRV